MRQQGRLTDWNDGKGFGFITPLPGGPTVFVHVSEFPRAQRRPILTDLVTYIVEHDDRGRPQARDVLFLAPTHSRSARAESSSRRLPLPVLALSLLFFIVVAAIAALGTVSWGVPGTYVVLSVVTFFAYGLDKRSAEKHQWRTAESTLHLLDVAGGWPGALIAQRVFHHKTVKQPFQTIFWFTVVANLPARSLLVPSAFDKVRNDRDPGRLRDRGSSATGRARVG
jgi:uncharacterized membrane protein YsdA (DUF1294 family)/cold shock CspA family protein